MSAPTPYYTDDLVTIYHGDCRDVREWLSADVLITDPPYGVGGALSMSGFASERRFGVQKWDDLDVRDEVLALWGDRPAAVFGSPRRLDRRPSYREVPLIWDKGNMVAMGDTSFPWRATYELIYVSGKPWRGFRDPAILRWPHYSLAASEMGHPSVKPQPLMQTLIGKSIGIVADPFMGQRLHARRRKEPRSPRHRHRDRRTVLRDRCQPLPSGSPLLAYCRHHWRHHPAR